MSCPSWRPSTKSGGSIRETDLPRILSGTWGEVSEEDLNQSRFAAYEPGDVVGKAGVEETYDEVLRGQDGSRDVIVDSHGREVGLPENAARHTRTGSEVDH